MLRATSARLWLGVRLVERTNYQVGSAPDARRPFQKSQNGVDAYQDHTAPQS